MLRQKSIRRRVRTRIWINVDDVVVADRWSLLPRKLNFIGRLIFLYGFVEALGMVFQVLNCLPQDVGWAIRRICMADNEAIRSRWSEESVHGSFFVPSGKYD